MRKYRLFLICFISSSLSAQIVSERALIFDPSIIRQYRTSIDEVISVIANYYEGVEYSDEAKLDASLHSSWQMRDNDGTSNNFIHIEDKATFIRRVRDHGNYENYASQRKIGAIEVIHDQLAFVRIDKSPSRSCTLFFLAKIDNIWIIIDKVWAIQEENFNPLPSNELLLSIQNFYHGQPINRDFDSKLLSANSYEFSLESKIRDHQIKLVSILGIYGRLAVVRTDYPALDSTAYIVLFRLRTGWEVACERISKKTQ